MKHILLFVILFPLVVLGQDSHFKNFENLINKTWKAEGTWNNGTKFIQEISFKYDLQESIIISNSKGFIDNEQTKIGNRNHGVRTWDQTTSSINFWEFDVFGGVTKGTVYFEGKNIIYTYDYSGVIVTDMWEYFDDSTYKFTVGIYNEEGWKQVFLETEFKQVNL